MANGWAWGLGGAAAAVALGAGGYAAWRWLNSDEPTAGKPEPVEVIRFERPASTSARPAPVTSAVNLARAAAGALGALGWHF